MPVDKQRDIKSERERLRKLRLKVTFFAKHTENLRKRKAENLISKLLKEVKQQTRRR